MSSANPSSTPRSRRAPDSASSCAGSISRGTKPRLRTSDRETGAAPRQLDAAPGRFQHVISGRLYDVGAPVQWLGLVFEEIGRGKRIAIGLDIAMAGGVAERCVAPAELPAGMLGADPPGVELHGQRVG